MRTAAFLAVGFVLLLLQGVLSRALGPVSALLGHLSPALGAAFTPSLVLPFVVFLGVHEHSMVRGALSAFLLGYLEDVLAPTPVGLYTFVFVSLWWIARLVGVRLVDQAVWSRLALGFVFSVAESLFVLTLLALFGKDSQRPLELSRFILPSALATALWAPFGFALAARLQRLGRVGRERQEGLS